ncbi:exosome complex exonuclease Rrp41 [Candidatus Woesearchaeota archaeon]|nr:exosome complex exonuclease Rrp41 [Candidatus Woesearchaeota archaeon]
MYTERFDGRKMDQTRPIEAKVGVIPRADGSAMFKIGKTVAYAAVYGPRELHPKFMQNPSTGILRCHYNMMPFSGHGDRVRPGTSRRSKEISMVMNNALLPVLDLKDYPNAVVDVFIELPQTDAGTRCAAICAASMALADAGLEMKDMVAAVAVGKVGGTVLADLNYAEEAYEEEGGSTDMPVAMIPGTGEVTLLQLDGDVSREDIKAALELAKKVCADIYEVQKAALKLRYKVD